MKLCKKIKSKVDKGVWPIFTSPNGSSKNRPLKSNKLILTERLMRNFRNSMRVSSIPRSKSWRKRSRKRKKILSSWFAPSLWYWDLHFWLSFTPVRPRKKIISWKTKTMVLQTSKNQYKPAHPVRFHKMKQQLHLKYLNQASLKAKNHKIFNLKIQWNKLKNQT